MKTEFKNQTPRVIGIQTRAAFTLVELLLVISIIAVVVAFTVPVLHMVKVHQYEQTTQAEMTELETAIDSYHAAFGFYPPDNPNAYTPTPSIPAGSTYDTINQLFFELMGVTNTIINGNAAFQTLDGRSYINASDMDKPNTFGTTGFMNCSKPNADESTPQARSFLFELKPNQFATNGYSPGTVDFLVPSVGGPDVTYPSTALGLTINPWRYNSSSPTNNPGSYDLWVQLSIGGKKYLICNWSKEVQINNPLP